MPLLVCPRGHRWESGDGSAGDQTTVVHQCPVCGRAPRAEPVLDVLPFDEPAPPPGPTAAWTPSESSAPALPPEAPTLLGPPPVSPAVALGWPEVPGYEIQGELGRGGMGVVYKARQVGLNRLVALKMILAGEHAGPEQRARFRREAEAVAKLHHPHIVQIYEIGEHQGRPYFSLEYVGGGTLAGRLHDGPLSEREAAGVVRTLAEAVHHAHQRNIIHRDLKPANILLPSVVRSPESVAENTEPAEADHGPGTTDYGLLKIADFGLGRVWRIRLTRVGR